MKLAAVFTLAFVLTACGSGSSDEDASEIPSERPSSAFASSSLGEFTSPKCEYVWVDGTTLPTNYEGCYDSAADTFQVGTSIPCPSGSAIFTYEPSGDGFYVGADGKVVQAGEDYANTPGYSKRYAECSS